MVVSEEKLIQQEKRLMLGDIATGMVDEIRAMARNEETHYNLKQADLSEVIKESIRLLKIYTKKENSYVAVSILDNGTGIPEEVMLKIWEPFSLPKDTKALESVWTFANVL